MLHVCTLCYKYNTHITLLHTLFHLMYIIIQNFILKTLCNINYTLSLFINMNFKNVTCVYIMLQIQYAYFITVYMVSCNVHCNPQFYTYNIVQY